MDIIDFKKGDVKRGAKIFKTKCSSCHTISEGGKNMQGPNLYGVVGRKSGTVPNFNYTNANKKSEIIWDKHNLFFYLTNPKKFIKGTNMAFSGIKKEKDKIDLISFLDNPYS